MDILYYSNFCKHSKKILDFIVKANLTNQLNFICIDKRSRDPKTYQILVTLENGKKVALPPNIHSVPSLLLVNDNYRLLVGGEIITHFEPIMKKKFANMNESLGGGEPSAFTFGTGSPVVSEQFTYYNMSDFELSAKGSGENRQMHHYAPADIDLVKPIRAPEETYKADKLSNEVTIDAIQQKRNADIPKLTGEMFSYDHNPFSGGDNTKKNGTKDPYTYVPSL
jgi:hypothetical protein